MSHFEWNIYNRPELATTVPTNVLAHCVAMAATEGVMSTMWDILSFFYVDFIGCECFPWSDSSIQDGRQELLKYHCTFIVNLMAHSTYQIKVVWGYLYATDLACCWGTICKDNTSLTIETLQEIEHHEPRTYWYIFQEGEQLVVFCIIHWLLIRWPQIIYEKDKQMYILLQRHALVCFLWVASDLAWKSSQLEEDEFFFVRSPVGWGFLHNDLGNEGHGLMMNG